MNMPFTRKEIDISL